MPKPIILADYEPAPVVDPKDEGPWVIAMTSQSAGLVSFIVVHNKHHGYLASAAVREGVRFRAFRDKAVAEATLPLLTDALAKDAGGRYSYDYSVITAKKAGIDDESLLAFEAEHRNPPAPVP